MGEPIAMKLKSVLSRIGVGSTEVAAAYHEIVCERPILSLHVLCCNFQPYERATAKVGVRVEKEVNACFGVVRDRCCWKPSAGVS